MLRSFMPVVIAFYIFGAFCSGEELRISKEAKASNPKIHLVHFDAGEQVIEALMNDLRYSDWFELGSSAQADYLLSVTYQEMGSKRLLSINISDNKGNHVCKFQKKSPLITPLTRLIHNAVDEIIFRVFGNVGFCSSKLAFVNKVNGNKEIWVSDFDGSNPQRLTYNETISVEPKWSARNKYLAYTLYGAYSTGVVLLDMEKGRQTRLSHFPGLNSNAKISNDNSMAALTLSKGENVDLYTINIETGKIVRLTHTAGAEASPCWSPNDESICYVSDQSGARPRLYLLPANGGTPERLLNLPGESVSPDWSSVSNKICFALYQGGRYTIAYIDMNNSDRTPTILVTEPGSWESPTWAADGRHIACARTIDDKKSLYLVDSYYRNVIPLKSPLGDISLPDYSDNFE